MEASSLLITCGVRCLRKQGLCLLHITRAARALRALSCSKLSPLPPPRSPSMASQVPIPKSSDAPPAVAPAWNGGATLRDEHERLARASEIGTQQQGYVDESGKSKLFRKLKQEPAVPIGESHCWQRRRRERRERESEGRAATVPGCMCAG